jgi:uncharacterized protein YgiM (DUF1202 family)
MILVLGINQERGILMNYQQIFNQKPVENLNLIPNKEVVNEKVPRRQPKKILKGIVTDCVRLNVREATSKDSKVLCILDVGTVVTIDMDETLDFDKIWVHIYVNNITGYVMCQYLKEVQ